MVANASTQIEIAKRAILPRADARAGEEKFATVSFWSEGDDNITVSGLSTHGLHGFYDQEQPEVASVDQSNQQYSILALTDSSGNVSERYAYTAYGQPTFLNASATVQTSSATGNRYTYTAREWDATLGLHHFRARWMSGLTGRFLTRDPVGYRGGKNQFSFVSNHALTGRDPLGLFLIGDVWPQPIRDELEGWWENIWPWQNPQPFCSSFTVGGKTCSQANFDEWYSKETVDLPNWLPKVKPCPCNIRCFQRTNRFNCKGDIIEIRNEKFACAPPGSGFSMTGFWGKSYHPSGEFELRQDPCGSPGNQCIYNKDGDLLTKTDAGTADKSSPCTLWGSADFEDDVRPYECAKCLGQPNVDKYHKVRPVNGGKPCKGGDYVFPQQNVVNVS